MPSLPFVYGYLSSSPRAHCTPNKSVPTLRYTFLHCCFTSREARWLIRDGDRVGRGRQSEGSTAETVRKNGETVDRRQNNGSVKAVSPRHSPATCALDSHKDNVRCTAVDGLKQKRSNLFSPTPPPYFLISSGLT